MIFHAHAVPSIQRAMDYVRGPGNDNTPGRAMLLGGQGFGFVPRTDDDVKLATAIMEHNAKFEMQASPTKKCTLDALHASLSWDPSQRADQDEMLEAGRTFLKSLGMEKSMAIFHRHKYTKNAHMHMVASLIDPKTGLTYDQYQFRYKGQRKAIEWEREKNQITPARQPQHDLARAAEELDFPRLEDLLPKKDGRIAYGKLDHALALGGHFGPHLVAHRIAFQKHLEREPEPEQEKKQMAQERTPDPWQTILEREVAKLEQRSKLQTKVLDFFNASDGEGMTPPKRERGPQEINGNFKDMTDATTPGLLPPKRNKNRGLER